LGNPDPRELQLLNPKFHRQLDPSAGQVLQIPEPRKLNDLTPGGGTYISINGQRFPYWESLTVFKQLDGFSSCSVDIPFDGDIAAYSPITLVYEGITMFKGTLLGPQPKFNTTGSRVTWLAYSKAGVLNDCQPLPGTSRQFYNKNLKQIAEEVVKPFGVGVEFNADEGKPFRSVERNMTMTAYRFLSDQAKLRGVFVSDNPVTGDIVFSSETESSATATPLSEGSTPVLSASVNFKSQQFYSEVTGVLEASSWHSGADYTWKNPDLTGVLRPHVFSLNNVAPGEVKEAVDAKARRMYSDAFQVTLRVAGWKNSLGLLWGPSSEITFTSPSLGFSEAVKLKVRKSIQRQNKNALETELFCILKNNEKFPWRMGG